MKPDLGLDLFKHVFTSIVAAGCIALAPAASASMIPGKTPAAEIGRNSQNALQKLYAKVPAAKAIGKEAYAVVVFPSVTKAGLGIGGQYGEGALIKGGKVVAYYSTAGASYGLQAGIQKYGYALFLMTDSAMKWIDKSDGWEIGVGPSIVVMDIGAGASATTTTIQAEIYAFFFDQKGLMGGLGLQGTKITRIKK